MYTCIAHQANNKYQSSTVPHIDLSIVVRLLEAPSSLRMQVLPAEKGSFSYWGQTNTLILQLVYMSVTPFLLERGRPECVHKPNG
jgi:hypothetical protein